MCDLKDLNDSTVFPRIANKNRLGFASRGQSCQECLVQVAGDTLGKAETWQEVWGKTKKSWWENYRKSAGNRGENNENFGKLGENWRKVTRLGEMRIILGKRVKLGQNPMHNQGKLVKS